LSILDSEVSQLTSESNQKQLKLSIPLF
jgi:hypothetical protein